MDGSGKSTQVTLLKNWLLERKFRPVVCRDPGTDDIAEIIRNILLDPQNRIDPVTEILLYAAARSALVTKKIDPALQDGQVVICDRFYDSTSAYQGKGRGLSADLIRQLNLIGSHGRVPDLTFFLDIDIETGLKRLDRQGSRDRMESETIQFKERVRRGFLELAAAEPERFHTVDGTRSESDLHGEIVSVIKKRFLDNA